MRSKTTLKIGSIQWQKSVIREEALEESRKETIKLALYKKGRRRLYD